KKHIIFGAPENLGAGTNAGAAYLFDLNGNLVTAFPNPNVSAGRGFGRRLTAMGNDRVLIGYDGGGAYLFSTNGALLTTFTNLASAFAPLGADRILFGAPGNPGVAYLFSESRALLTTFTNPAPTSGFGATVAAVGEHLLISA